MRITKQLLKEYRMRNQVIEQQFAKLKLWKDMLVRIETSYGSIGRTLPDNYQSVLTGLHRIIDEITDSINDMTLTYDTISLSLKLWLKILNLSSSAFNTSFDGNLVLYSYYFVPNRKIPEEKFFNWYAIRTIKSHFWHCFHKRKTSQMASLRGFSWQGQKDLNSQHPQITIFSFLKKCRKTGVF